MKLRNIVGKELPRKFVYGLFHCVSNTIADHDTERIKQSFPLDEWEKEMREQRLKNIRYQINVFKIYLNER